MVKFATFLSGLFGLIFAFLAIGVGGAIWAALTQGERWNGIPEIAFLAVVAAGIATAADMWRKRILREERASAAPSSRPSRTTPVAPGQSPGLPRHGRPTGKQLLDMDAIMFTYDGQGIDYRIAWDKANRTEREVPPFGQWPYWALSSDDSEILPRTSLAFWSEDDRVLTAAHPDTAEDILSILEEDPSTRVRQAIRDRA